VKTRPFFADRVALACAIVIAGIAMAAAFAPVLAPFAYDAQDGSALLSAPGGAHYLGTDRLGRDLLSRMLYGARVSMAIGVLTSLIAILLGTFYGAVSGYAGGRTDNTMMRIIDAIYPFPDLLLIILITMFTGRGTLGMVMALSLVSWVTVARLMRGETLRLKEQAFVESARAAGVGGMAILWRHILPNALGPLIVTLTFRIPAVILSESTLSFIGLGLMPPEASWGTLAEEGWKAMRFAPHLIIVPSSAIFLTVMSFNLLGDRLRDHLDPVLSGRGKDDGE
jgi:ABC-type dipeptide/oligopeptide/nickel transport system permease subunit